LTEDEWNEIVADVCGIWNINPDTPMGERRIAAWSRRWSTERADVFSRAMRQLEKDSRHMPSAAEVNAALAAVRKTDAMWRERAEPAGEDPVSSPERRMIAAHLRGEARKLGSQYLADLADFYDTNAQLSEQGQPILWPPSQHLASTPATMRRFSREPGEEG
jgi:hypothetical protein